MAASKMRESESMRSPMSAAEGTFEELSRMGNALVNSSDELTSELGDAVGNVQGHLDEGRIGDARQRFSKWRGNVKALQHHMNDQLRFCRNLRKSRVLLSLYDEDAHERSRKLVNQAVSKIKADVRSTNVLFTESTLKLQKLSRFAQEHLCLRQHAAQEAKILGIGDGGGSDDLGLGLGTSSSSSVAHSRDGSEASGGMSLRECRLLAIDCALKSVREPEHGDPAIGAEDVVHLLSVRSLVLTSLLDHLIKQKKALDEEFGVDSDKSIFLDRGVVDSLRDGGALRSYDFGESEEAHLLHDVAFSFLSMIRVVRACRLLQASDVENVILELDAEKHELRQNLKAMKMDNEQLQDQIRRLEEKEGAQLTTSERVRLDNALRQIDALEEEVTSLREANAQATSEQSRLNETITRMREAARTQQREHEERTSWFEPHINKLEHVIENTSKSFKSLSLDVELISSMYRKSLVDLDGAKQRMRDLEDERDVMGQKLLELNRRLQASRREEERLSKVSTRALAARRAAHGFAQEMQGKMTEASSSEAAMKEQVDFLESRIDSLQGTSSGYARKLAELKEQHSAVKSSLKQRDEKIKLLTSSNLEMKEQYENTIAQMKANPLTPEMQKEFDDLRARHREAQRASVALEKLLAKSEVKISTLEEELMDVRGK